jgi:competence protein ComEA
MRHFLSIAALVAVFAAGLSAVPAGASAIQAKPAEAKAAPAPIVNINTAPAEQLERLPGVGARTAARIVEYRQKNGGFKKVEELMNVRGIGEKTILRMKSQLTVAAAKADPQ